MRILFSLLLAGFTAMSGLAQAGTYEVRGYLGASYYQGDLAPLPMALSFSPGRLTWALSVGRQFTNLFSLHARLTVGQLGADDADAGTESRRIRNLRFDSPLYEASLMTEWNINHWLKGFDKYGIQLYYTTGIGIFHFNPQTQVGGELVELQPLGTEGQGLPGFPEPYALTQINIPFGLGMKFNLGSRVKFGLEITPRWTFTDYLDDVSGAYVNTSVFLDAEKFLTAQLANRTGEYFGGSPIDYATGSMRGQPENNDWYFFGGLSLSYTIGNLPENIDLEVKVETEVLPEKKDQ